MRKNLAAWELPFFIKLVINALTMFPAHMLQTFRARGVLVAGASLLAFFAYASFAFAATNVILNPNFQAGAGNTATNWQTAFDGTGTKTFTINTPDRSGTAGTRAARVAISGGTSASAARWQQSAPIAVNAGEYYTFSDWYKSATTTEIDVYYTCSTACTTNDGVTHPAGEVFQWIADVAPSATWAQLPEKGILIPQGVTSMIVTHTLVGNGTLDTDDYSLVKSDTAPLFAQGLVSLTFDDGLQTFADNAVPVLNASGLKATNYIITGPDGSNLQGAGGTPNSGYMSKATIQSLATAGFDIGAHTRNHLDLVKQTLPVTAGGSTYTTQPQMWSGEVNGSVADLVAAGVTPTSLAYPYGSYNAALETQVQGAGLSAARSVDQGYNFTLGDKYALKMQHVRNTTTVGEIEGWINYATANKVWLILMFHEVRAGVNDDTTNYPTGASTGQCTDPANPALPDADCTSKDVLAAVSAYLQALTPGTVVTMAQGIQAMNAASNRTITASAGANGTITPSGSVSVANGTSQSFTFAPATGFMLGTLTVDGVATTTVNPFTFSNVTANHTIDITFVADNVPPAVTLTTSATSPTNAATIPVTATFSKAVTGFDVADISVTNGTAGSFVATSTTVYTFNVTPTADGVVSVSVPAAAASDAASSTLMSAVSNTLSVVSNRTTPIIKLTGDAYVSTPVNQVYTDAGATILGTTTLPNVASTVSTSSVGMYTVTYTWTDAAGNVATSVTRAVAVTELGGVSSQASTNVTANSFTVTWTTGAPATSRVVYDTVSHAPLTTTTSNYGYANSTTEDAATTTSHSVMVTGLNPNTTYYFRAISHASPDVLGAEMSITTGSNPAPVVSGGGGGGGGGGNGPVSGTLGGGSLVPGAGIAVPGGSSTGGGSVLGASTFKFLNNLSRGMTHGDVIELQKRLVTEGFLVIDAPTSYFGNMTFAAVKKYQASHGIDQLGNVGPKTRAALNGGTTASTPDAAKQALIDALKAKLAELMKKIADLLAAGAGTSSTASSTTPVATTTTPVMSTSTMMIATSTPVTTGTTTSMTTGTTTTSTASSTQQ